MVVALVLQAAVIVVLLRAGQARKLAQALLQREKALLDEQLAQCTRALNESDVRSRALFEHAGIGLADIDSPSARKATEAISANTRARDQASRQTLLSLLEDQK